MRTKFLLLLSIFCIPLLGQLRVPERLGKVAIANMEDGFAVLKDGKLENVEFDCMDSMLRKMSFKQRNDYILKGGSLEVNQASNGQYTLKSVASLKGGGLLGAGLGAKIGYFAVHFVCHTGILIISACTGPLAPATFASLEATAMPFILVAAKGGAVAGGIIGGVATGPV